MATVVREAERKYDPAAAGPAVPEVVKAMTGTTGVAAVSQQAEQLLDAVYYGTADLRLTAVGITLRRRTGGEDAGWHLKLPAGTDMTCATTSHTRHAAHSDGAAHCSGGNAGRRTPRNPPAPHVPGAARPRPAG